jgi:transposase
MDEPNQKPLPEEETTELHLNKFAPGQGRASGGTAPSIDDSATIFIRKAAAETVGQSNQPVVTPKAGNALPAEEMLGAVAYCYAKGVYTSEEIERKMMKDTELRAATGGELPDANTIRRFRRNNRGAIQATLEKWFRKLRKQRAVVPTEVLPGAHPPELSPLPGSSASVPLSEPTTLLAKREASERLNKAAFIDNMSKDG